MAGAKQRTVRVDGEDLDIWVAQDGRVTWRAWGQFRGRQFDATGTSESNAVDRWQQKADYIAKG